MLHAAFRMEIEGSQDHREPEHQQQHEERKTGKRKTRDETPAQAIPRFEICTQPTQTFDHPSHTLFFCHAASSVYSWRRGSRLYPVLTRSISAAAAPRHHAALALQPRRGCGGASGFSLFRRVTPAELQGRREDGDHLAESVSGVAVAHLRQREAPALHCVAQLPFVQARLVS